MQIDFYYWGTQCPISYETIKLLNSLNSNLFNVNFYDITDNKALAKKMNMYFPFLTVFKNSIRWRSPININLINKIRNGEEVKEQPYMVDIPSNKYRGKLIKLTNETISEVKACCTMSSCSDGCKAKGEFLSQINGEFLGYLNFNGNKIVGGAEYVSSMVVPYNVPRDEETAFLTCSYLSYDVKCDNKSYPLEALEKQLKFKFKKIIAISDEKSVFPNGSLKWFQGNGYKDEGLVSIEENYANLHLVSKRL